MPLLSHIRSRIEFIAALVDPRLWELVEPHGGSIAVNTRAEKSAPHGRPPAVNTHAIELMTAEAVRQAGELITDPAQAKAAKELSRAMIAAAAEGIAHSSAEDGDICPPYDKIPEWLKEWLRHHPPPPPPPGPDEIWDRLKQPVEVLVQLDVVGALVQLSKFTYSEKANKQLLTIAAGIASPVSKALADDVFTCGTQPRPIGPRPRVGKAAAAQVG